MSEQSGSADYPDPPLAEVLPLRRPEGVEFINGKAMRLGSMSLQTLLAIEDDCRNRFVEAQTDLMIVQDIREGRFPESAGPS